MTAHDHVTEQLAEKNNRRWLSSKEAHARLKNRNVEENVGPYLTVSREHGAGGSEIARRVGELLGWEVLDHELLDQLAEKYGTPRDLLEYVDEKNIDWISSMFESWTSSRGVTQIAYIHRMSNLLLLAAHHGNVVIVGRGARFILPRERGIAVRILAPIEFRAEQIMLREGITFAEAKQFAQQADRERQAFKEKYFHHRAADPHEYDLVINVQKLDLEDAVNLIVSAVRSWQTKSGVRSPSQ